MVKILLDEFRPVDEPIWAVYPRRSHLIPKVQNGLNACVMSLLRL